MGYWEIGYEKVGAGGTAHRGVVITAVRYQRDGGQNLGSYDCQEPDSDDDALGVHDLFNGVLNFYPLFSSVSRDPACSPSMSCRRVCMN